MEKIARLRYSKKDDKYIIELYNDDTNTWELESAYRCVKSANWPESGAEFVHYRALLKIMELIDLGYDIHMSQEGE